MKKLILGLLVVSSCGHQKEIGLVIEKAIENYPHDNFVEEIIEDHLENITGIDLDLSPSSKEKE